MLFIIIFIIVLFIFLRFWFTQRKKYRFDCVSLVVGAPKTGKTTLQVYLAIKEYRKRLRCWYLKRFLKPKKYKTLEKPLLYSNIPLSIPHVRLTKDLLLRKVRFAFNSVIILSETSLVADSMSATIKTDDQQKNNFDLNMFYKLIGHELHGGAVFTETQNPSDNHYALRRCLNRYLFIQRCIKWIPFIIVFKVREMAYLDGENVNIINTVDNDLEKNTLYYWCFKSVWKKFDAYAYSIFTDNLPICNNVVVGDKNYLKADEVVSFNKRFLKLDKGCEKND